MMKVESLLRMMWGIVYCVLSLSSLIVCAVSGSIVEIIMIF